MFFQKLIFALAFAAFFIPTEVGATAIVTGVLANATANERVELRVPHYYVDGKSTAPVALLDERGRFSFAVEVPEPQLAYLIHNEDRLPIFLEPNDSLHIESDIFQFPLVVTFSGRAGQNNRLLRLFLLENPQDFNEFNNLRYKIGHWWTSVEVDMDRQMDALGIADFRAMLDKRKAAAFALLDDYARQYPGQASAACLDFLAAESLYDWAYHLLMYGTVYKNKHGVEPPFFEFLYDAPSSSDMVGSDAYRRFVLTLMAWRQAQVGKTSEIFAEQYLAATDYLGGKALAFFRSEILMQGLKAEKYGEVLPFYTQFLQNNPRHEYDFKITDLHEKAVRVSPGVAAPNFSGRDWFGKDLSLAQFRGKVVYLNFWASWCAACIQKMNIMDGFAAEFRQQGVVVLNVSMDDDPVAWNTRIGEEQFQGEHILASAPLAAGGKSIAQLFNVEAVPQYFLIGKDGAFMDKGWSNQPDDIRKRLIELSMSK